MTAGFPLTVAGWGAAFGALSVAANGRGGRPAAGGSGWELVVRTLGGPAWEVAVAWALALVVALVLHEAGHAVAARWAGSPRVEVTLAGLHGRTAYELADPWSARRAVVVASGALAPLLLMPLVAVPRLQPCAVVGGLLTALNVLPVPTSDGGHLVTLAVHRLGPPSAHTERLGRWLSFAISSVVVLATAACHAGALTAVVGVALLAGAGTWVVADRHAPAEGPATT